MVVIEYVGKYRERLDDYLVALGLAKSISLFILFKIVFWFAFYSYYSLIYEILLHG